MDGGKGRRMKRCAEGAPDKAIINRIMLRFRPIAPKPAAGGSCSGGSAMDDKNLFVTKGRTKRKYVRVRRSSGYKRNRRTAVEKMKDRREGLEKRSVTLQLLPERSERKESPECGFRHSCDRTVTRKNGLEKGDAPTCLDLDMNVRNDTDRTIAKRQMVGVLESWVTVESVTNICMGMRGLGTTDAERIRNLEDDTCPGFISDDLNRVFWLNGAFKRMLSHGRNNVQSPEMVTVRLVTKDKLLHLCTEFSCQVKLQNTWEKENYSQIVPCDVSRMDGGGFAWRMDVEAALSLGR